MDTKEKIKLLADLQGAVDNEDLRGAISALPSGAFIWEKVLNSLNGELEAILSGKVHKSDAVALETLAALLQRLDRTMVVQVLRTLDTKLSQSVTTNPAYPPLEENPPNQEELQRQWEQQQLGQTPSKRGRSSVAGPF